MTQKLYHLLVCKPAGDELSRVIKMYRILGLQGAIGSMDVTQVVYGRCPKHLKHYSFGKEGVLTLAFSCVVD